MSAGLSATTTPAASRAAILSVAVPLPPEMIAPAWPIRLPGGAVRPAMNAADRFGDVFLDVRRRLFFGVAADFADHQNRFGPGIVFKQSPADR